MEWSEVGTEGDIEAVAIASWELNIPSGGIRQTLGSVFTFSQSTSTSFLSNSLIRSSVGIVINVPIPSWEEDEEGEGGKGASY